MLNCWTRPCWCGMPRPNKADAHIHFQVEFRNHERLLGNMHALVRIAYHSGLACACMSVPKENMFSPSDPRQLTFYSILYVFPNFFWRISWHILSRIPSVMLFASLFGIMGAGFYGSRASSSILGWLHFQLAWTIWLINCEWLWLYDIIFCSKLSSINIK